MNDMKKIYVFEVFTGKDITPFVSLRIGKDGEIRVFNSAGIDITENIYFGIE